MLRAIPRPDEPWGVLAALRGSSWERMIREVEGEDYSNAMNGFATPMLRNIGRAPKDALRRLPILERQCKLRTSHECAMASEKCVPGTGEVPFCYEAPGEHSRLASRVALAMDQGRYVIVLKSPEFTLKRG
jgi:hypothetical protein